MKKIIILAAVMTLSACVEEPPSTGYSPPPKEDIGIDVDAGVPEPSRPDADNSTDALNSTNGGDSGIDVGTDSGTDSGPDATEDMAFPDPDLGADAETCEETYYPDNDGDGYGTTLYPRDACTQPEGYVVVGGDCDDTNSDVNPSEEETCDGVDNTCSGSEDDAIDLQTFYRDLDGDGYGDASSPLVACFQPEGYVATTGDCADDPNEDPSAIGKNEGIPVSCGSVGDWDCNGIDDRVENPATRHYCDRDGDGYGTATQSALICPATPPTRCSGTWVTSQGDLDETDATVYPGAPEACDGVDNNQDGTVDENCSCVAGASESCGSDIGACVSGIRTCDLSGTWGTCSQGYIPPTTEVCDGADNDCDGQTDEGLGVGLSCSTGQDGLCSVGVQECLGGQVICAPLNTSQPETCDGLDNDCDGQTDEGLLQTFYRDEDGDLIGVEDPALNVESCSVPQGYAAGYGDNCPAVSNPSQLDSNQNGFGDACEPCGDGAVAVGEACDDGNAVSGDGCSSTCQLESGYVCDPEVGCTTPCKEYVGRVLIYVDEPTPVPNIPDNSVQTGVQILDTHCSIDGQLDIRTSRSGDLTPIINGLSSTPLKVKSIRTIFIQADAVRTVDGLENLLYIPNGIRIRWDGSNNYLNDTSHFHNVKEVGYITLDSNTTNLYNADGLQTSGHAPWESLETVNAKMRIFRVGSGGTQPYGFFADFPALTYVNTLEIGNSSLTPTQVCDLVALSSVVFASNGVTCP